MTGILHVGGTTWVEEILKSSNILSSCILSSSTGPLPIANSISPAPLPGNTIWVQTE